MISSSQRPLPDNTQHSQQKNIHAPGGIRTHNLSRRAAADLRLRLRGHWDRQQDATIQVNLLFLVSSTCFGRCFRPSSGEFDCIYSICCLGWVETQFQLIQDTSRQQPGWVLPDTVNKSSDPGDGRKNRPKHVELTKNNKLTSIVASCRSQWPRGLGLRKLACWNRGFESHRGHGYLSVVSVVCCQVEVSATSWSLVQRSLADCGASLCVI